MNSYYLDTSALVKRYVDETGSDWLRAIVDPAHLTLDGYNPRPTSRSKPLNIAPVPHT